MNHIPDRQLRRFRFFCRYRVQVERKRRKEIATVEVCKLGFFLQWESRKIWNPFSSQKSSTIPLLPRSFIVERLPVKTDTQIVSLASISCLWPYHYHPLLSTTHLLPLFSFTNTLLRVRVIGWGVGV